MGITYCDKSVYVRTVRIIFRTLAMFKLRPKLLYDILLPLKSKYIKLFSPREQKSFFVQSRNLDRFINGIDWKRYNTNNLYPTIFSYLKKKENPVIVEIGSAFGEEVTYLSSIAGPKGRVICFEPMPDSFACLKKNIETLDLRNVTVHNLCAGKESRQIVIKDRIWSRNDEEASDNEQRPSVNTVRLDDFLSTEESLDLIKIDTDGYDADVLEGAMGLIKKHNPTIIIEYLPSMDYSGKKGEAALERYIDMGFDIHLPQFHLNQVTKGDLSHIVKFFKSPFFSMTHDVVLTLSASGRS